MSAWHRYPERTPQGLPDQQLIPYNDSPVDMQRVLDFYHSIYDRTPCDVVSQQVREFAKSRCDMNTTMKAVAEWISN